VGQFTVEIHYKGDTLNESNERPRFQLVPTDVYTSYEMKQCDKDNKANLIRK